MKYIDNTTYEILNEKTDNCFEVADGLAQTVSILNQKGYLTEIARIGQNYSNGLIDTEEARTLTNEERKEIHQKGYITELKENNTYVINIPLLATVTYIKFKDNIKLPFIPKKFYKDNSNGVCYRIKYYKHKNKARSNEEINADIEAANKLFLEWAQNLPEYSIK